VNVADFRRFRFVPAIVIGFGLLYLLTHGDGEGGKLRPPAERRPVELAFPVLGGGDWSLAAERGHVVLVNFWATWCGPCRAETPVLVRIADAYRGRGVAVVGVAADDRNTADVRAFVKNYRVTYPILMPPPESAAVAAIQALPTTLLIDRQGRLARSLRGAREEAVFQRDIDALLAESP
jgi:thiol-disulfide isomerase/thioredoxin